MSICLHDRLLMKASLANCVYFFCRKQTPVLLEVHLTNATGCFGSHSGDQVHIQRPMECGKSPEWDSESRRFKASLSQSGGQFDSEKIVVTTFCFKHLKFHVAICKYDNVCVVSRLFPWTSNHNVQSAFNQATHEDHFDGISRKFSLHSVFHF